MTVSVWTLIETAPPVTDWTLLGDDGGQVVTLANEGQLARVVAVVGPSGGGGGGGGGVSAVAMSVPTGFSIAGSPILSAGTFILSFAAGYALPTNAAQAQWDQAFGWGNHAVAGYLTPAAIGVSIQEKDADLDSLSAASATDAIYYRSAPNTWVPITIGANMSFAGGVLSAAGGGGGGLSDGDYGDITVSSSSTVLTIDPGAVTFAKFQSIATNRFVGRISGGSGAVEELTGANARTIMGLATGDSPEFTGLNIGHASDTTITRTGAGVIAIEGHEVTTNDGAQTLTNKTLTTPAMTDPVITGCAKEDVYTVSDGAGFEIDPSNGTLQTVTLGASRTPAATNFQDGEWVLLGIDDGSGFTITWTTVGVVWDGGSAPTLATSGKTWVLLWKQGGTIRGKQAASTAS